MSSQSPRSTRSVLTCLALAGTAIGLCASASLAAPFLTASFPNVPSYKLSGDNGNAHRTVAFGTTNNSARVIHISGTLNRRTNGTFPREAAIRFNRFTRFSPTVSVLTHTFIAQPLTTTSFDANGNATIADGTFVLPVPQNYNFNGGFSAASMFDNGFWDIEFFEQYDDNAADTGSTPDAVWTNITFTFDDEAPSLTTPAPLTGTVASSTFYGARSDDTLDVGAFTGSILSNLNMPSGDRIRHVRVSGYLTNLVAYTTPPGVSAPQIGQARLRLVRNESVLLSPNDPQALSTTDELFIAVPNNIPSSGWVSIDVPIGPNDNFGKLTRNVPNPSGSSYFGINYYANCYESIDDPAPVDSIWNGIKIEFFTQTQPNGNAVDFGTLVVDAGAETVASRSATMNVGSPLWYRFQLPVGIDAGGTSYLDIDTENTSPLFDTMIGLYAGDGALVGQLAVADDDDGSGTLSQLSFGSTSVRPGFATAAPRDGRDGALAAGVYYVAVVPYSPTLGLGAFGASNFSVTNADTTAHFTTLNLRYNLPAAPIACSPADIAGGGAGGNSPDGVVDGTDFVAFINSFAIGDVNINAAADINTDGVIDGSDFVAFINAFALGC